MDSHTSRDFDSELRELRAHVLAMGARCERSLQLALDAFFSGSDEAAREVERIDRQIDRDEMDIDALVLRILALRQPVAFDLRLVTTALKLVTDLERIGDEAVNIAERAREGHHVAQESVQRDLQAMASLSQEMLREALDSFVQSDTVRARAVLDRDDAVDILYGGVLKAMMDHMTENPTDVPPSVRMIKAAKYIERIADHATNIAEEVIFMVGGDDVRHLRTHPPPPVGPNSSRHDA
jgi:phosphate transport system protein